ncbi:hypothetical protein T265_10322 [Opisthorchis viverrini]|uniref:FAD-binding domain-containing protein n=1 Tax=Opisthorchis viverrini TaxID=6198 RepID=A0A075A1P3_OPIVI|nr:hypothetical protein T265_10322 [Opisthorchis viverrini]KER21319.1 hypothetical protein T265_10322 [Opisthorchis viverrini]
MKSLNYGLSLLDSGHAIVRAWLGHRFPSTLRMPKKSSSVNQIGQVSVVEELRADLARKLLEAHSYADDEKCLEVWEDQCDAFLTFERDPLAYVVENSLVVESLRRAAVENSDNLTVMYDTQARNIQLPSVDQLDQLVQLEAHVLNSSDPPLLLETSLLVWEDQCDAFLTFERDPLAYVVENSLVVESLRRAAVENSDNLTVMYDTQARNIQLPSVDQLDQLVQLEAHVLNSSDPPLLLETSLLLSDKHSCLIWSTTSAEAGRLTSLNDAEFVWEVNNALTRPNPPPTGEMLALSRLGKALATAVDYSLGKSSPLTESAPIPPQVEGIQPNTIRARYPLGFQHADFYHAPRVALAGILPLAGQGVNLGFGDLMSLIRCLEDAVSQGADIASLPHLQDYTADRQRTVAVIAVTLEVLNALYSRDAVYSKVFGTSNNLGAYEDSPLLRLANRLVVGIRGAGVSAIQSSALAKAPGQTIGQMQMRRLIWKNDRGRTEKDHPYFHPTPSRTTGYETIAQLVCAVQQAIRLRNESIVADRFPTENT